MWLRNPVYRNMLFFYILLDLYKFKTKGITDCFFFSAYERQNKKDYKKKTELVKM